MRFGVCFVLALLCVSISGADEWLPATLEKAGENRDQMQRALEEVPDSQREGMEFLIRHMPDRDLKTLKADYLLENVRLAYEAWESANWRDQIPKDVFLNDVLPYASVTETREDWRADFYERFAGLVRDAQTAGEAAAILNNNIFRTLNVKYSTKRRRPDQSPSESIEQGLASCSGLSVLLIDACRAVGVPSRFVGTPLWSNRSGNHSWVEIYDNGWHFTGACEATGSDLNRGWFVDRASKAIRDNRLHAIYASSYRKTPVTFPLVWDRKADYVYAVNVTDRYTRLKEELPEGTERVMFVAMRGDSNERVSLRLVVSDMDGSEVFRGVTNDESFDRNDHISAPLKVGETYDVRFGEFPIERVRVVGDDQLVVFQAEQSDPTLETKAKGPTKSQIDEMVASLWTKYRESEIAVRKAENTKREITIGERKMPFWYKVFGEKPADGRRLFISMHGGGGAPARVNDQQYENQKRLYQPEEGVYFVPRAPTDHWNLWHEAHIDDFFQRVIENMVLLEGVNPDRVYIMGYSAGGDGVFQLAPRMADRLAAAAMMAGHPNETTPEGLRNLPFTIHMGGLDKAYNRNQKAAQWKARFAELHAKDPGGYVHEVTIHKGMGHWMQRKDAVAVQWMAKFTRNRFPESIVWKQDDRTHSRFYWVAVDEADQKAGAVVRVKRDGQSFEIVQCDVPRLRIRVNDDMIDFDKNVRVVYKGNVLFDEKLNRQRSVVAETFAERHDVSAVFSGEIEVAIPR
ncbi:transglutaminase domain-containing protein [Rhodopirellula sallentina]|uniref:Transglutaminase domain protein n=1 Tax=Rhodopirellula sallentina SM41 TaxID=1263870 RepID=M5UN29_9BACT|nr:transglutaminase domain-containing protein [Rhodopirellula sallentina]EMI57418.1 transglutaminase domain protein [Rhodopirellula sallentina SM41]